MACVVIGAAEFLAYLALDAVWHAKWIESYELAELLYHCGHVGQCGANTSPGQIGGWDSEFHSTHGIERLQLR